MDDLQRRHTQIIESILRRHAFQIVEVQPSEGSADALRYSLIEKRAPICMHIEVRTGLISSWTDVLLQIIEAALRKDHVPMVALLTSVYKDIIDYQESAIRIRQP